MPDNNEPIGKPIVADEYKTMVDAQPGTDPRSAYRLPVIMDLLALILIVIGITVAVIGVHIVLGTGFTFIATGVALGVLGVAVAYR